MLSRLGATPMHLGEPIVLLPAVHFHFSGFALSVIADATGRALRADSTASKIFRFVAIGLIGGTFLIAIGFLTSPLVKVAGNRAVRRQSLAAVDVSAGEPRGDPRTFGAPPAGVAASSLAVGMALALLYGVESTWAGWSGNGQVHQVRMSAETNVLQSKMGKVACP